MAALGRPPRRGVPNIVIDVGSSPEPAPRRQTRSASRTRAIASQDNMKGKGKGKASLQSNNSTGKRVLGPVIELTDSESEKSAVMKNNRNEKKRQEDQAHAGPSRPKPFPMLRFDSSNNPPLTTVTARASLENIPVAYTSSKRKAPEATPIFLPTQSDEENEPPLMGANPGPAQRAANLGEQGTEPLPIGTEGNQEMRPDISGYRRDRVIQPAVAPAADRPIPDPQQRTAQFLNAQPIPNSETQPLLSVEPIPQQQKDPTSHTLAQILEIIPDVDPEYLLGLINTHLPNFGAQTTEHILGLLFEDVGYPRVDKNKGKRKAVEAEVTHGNADGRPNKKVKVDYATVERPFAGGPVYEELALVRLQISFPFIPKPFLRRCLQQNRGFYAPTHLAIAAMENRYKGVPMGPRPYTMKSTRYNPSKDIRKYRAVVDDAFVEERLWLTEHLQDPNETNAVVVGIPSAGLQVGPEANGKGKSKAVEEEEEEPVEDGTGIECQCCFSEYAFDRMVQCPETHLFCSSCVFQYAATKLGEHDPSIVCMHASGCAQPFTPSELRRVLSPKLMELYERVKQQKEIQEASLDGLEECPFCEWKCVIEASVEEEKLFRCGNEEGGCGELSCRLCKKKDHLPKSCKEVEEDKKLDGRHAIEEAMTRALMRNCPKCHKAFVKEAGCNKMTCPNCQTLSCYICRKVIAGYDHFDQVIYQTPQGRPTTSRSGGKCLLWDNVEERHVAEVKAAAEKAAADYKRDHPDVDDKDIKVDIPEAPKPPAPQPANLMNRHPFVPGLRAEWYVPPQGQPILFPNNPALLQGQYLLPPLIEQPRRHTRAQQQRLLRAEPYLERQRQLEQNLLDLGGAMDRFAQQHQLRQHALNQQQEAVRLENQRYYNELYQQERMQLEQERRDQEPRAQQMRQNLEVQRERLVAQQQAQQRLLEDALRRHNEEREQQARGIARRVPRAVDAIPAAPALRGAVGARRARRG